MFKDFVMREAIDTLQEEKDPIWIKLIQLAEARNIKVFLTNKITGKAEGIYFRSNSKGLKNICIVDSIKGSQRRFVMAHELGHAVLHDRHLNCSLYFKDNEYRGRIEREADVFAERLLKLLEKNKRSKPDFEPDPPATAGAIPKYVVTTAVSRMAA